MNTDERLKNWGAYYREGGHGFKNRSPLASILETMAMYENKASDDECDDIPPPRDERRPALDVFDAQDMERTLTRAIRARAISRNAIRYLRLYYVERATARTIERRMGWAWNTAKNRHYLLIQKIDKLFTDDNKK